MTLSYPRGRLACLPLAMPVALVALICSAVGVSAAGPIKLGLTPVGTAGSNFTLTMQPGESRNLAVELANHGAEPVLTRTFAADAYSMVNGGFAARLDGEPSGGATSWLSYAAQNMDLAPGTAVDRDFSVAVPAATPPGEYLTTVVLQNAMATSPDAPGQSGMVLKQIIRQVVAISIDVPGPRKPSLQVGTITHSIVANRSTISVVVHNSGNVRLKPTGELVLWDSTGKEVTRFPITMDTVYAHTDTSVEVPFSQRLNPGTYTAELNLTDASGVSATSNKLPLTISDAVAVPTLPPVTGASPLAQTNQTSPVSVVPTNPWMMALLAFGAGLGLMLALAGGGFLVYRHRRSGPVEPEQPPA